MHELVSTGDEYYSPYFVLENAGGHVYNGPIVSMGASIEELQQYCDGIPPEKEEAARKVRRFCVPDINDIRYYCLHQ